jgi:hypothetical protein
MGIQIGDRFTDEEGRVGGGDSDDSVSSLGVLNAFVTEHQWGGELDAGVDGPVVWIACDCERGWHSELRGACARADSSDGTVTMGARRAGGEEAAEMKLLE